MQISRFYAFGRHCYGSVEGDLVRLLEGNPYEAALVPTDTTVPRDVVHWLPPCEPTKIVCIGSNYRAHCEEMGRAVPERPTLFLKPPSALVAHGAAIALPAGVGRVDFEGELAVVIGRRARDVAPEAVRDYLLGCTILNDVTAREIQRSDVQFTRGKGFDTFCPVGPCIETDVDPADLAIRTAVNGVLKQDSRTSDMVFDVAHLVAFISQVMTLEPGDIVSTGTPSGVGPLSAGDRVTVSIGGIGTLENDVVNR